MTSIGDETFRDCVNLTSITFSKGLKSIGGGKNTANSTGYYTGVFRGCTSLTSIVLPEGLTSIGPSAFQDCSKLKKITILSKDPVWISSSYAFSGCPIKDVYYAGSKKNWETMIRWYPGLKSAKVHYISGASEQPAKGTVLKSGKNSYKVTTAGSAVAFTKTTSTASSITIPKTVKIDGITYKVTSVSANAFKNNKKLTKVTIGNNVTSIGDNAFNGCKKLTSVTIGTGVKKIGKQAFKGCSKLKTITVKSEKLTSVGTNALKGIKSTAKIKVPKKKLTTYKKLFRKKGQPSKVKISA